MDVMSRFRIDGRRALVTGGNRGLGRVFSDALAEAGADVAVVSTKADQAAEAAAQIAGATGRKTVGIGADVSDPADVKRMAEEAAAALGPVDILVNNAGVNVRKDTVDLSAEEWDRVIDVNLKGPFLCCQALGPGMAERGWGRIVNVSSMLGLVGLARRPPYTASKGGLITLTKSLALEWAPRNVLVNALCPGPFATDMNIPLTENEEVNQWFIDRIPLGRWGKPEELGAVVVFLASEACSFMTGEALVADGGWIAQ